MTNIDRQRAVHEELNFLLYQALRIIQSDREENRLSPESAKLYSLEAHCHLMTCAAKNIFYPLGIAHRPKKYAGLKVDPQHPWPAATVYLGAMSVVLSPHVPAEELFFGYAVIDRRLERCAFFSPEENIAIDPVGRAKGIKADYYIGCNVPIEDISGYLAHRTDPLEAYVKSLRDIEEQESCGQEQAAAYLRQFENPGLPLPSEFVRYAERLGLPMPAEAKRA